MRCGTRICSDLQAQVSRGSIVRHALRTHAHHDSSGHTGTSQHASSASPRIYHPDALRARGRSSRTHGVAARIRRARQDPASGSDTERIDSWPSVLHRRVTSRPCGPRSRPWSCLKVCCRALASEERQRPAGRPPDLASRTCATPRLRHGHVHGARQHRRHQVLGQARHAPQPAHQRLALRHHRPRCGRAGAPRRRVAQEA
jgi:hypothetical protein